MNEQSQREPKIEGCKKKKTNECFTKEIINTQWRLNQ